MAVAPPFFSEFKKVKVKNKRALKNEEEISMKLFPASYRSDSREAVDDSNHRWRHGQT